MGRRQGPVEDLAMSDAAAKPSPAFWRGKRVLLTGHTGFKGSWLSLWLQSMGGVVRGVALPPPTQPALFEVANVAQGMEHCVADVRDFASLRRHVDEFRPEVVIHMAAQPLVRQSYELPVETYATNVMGTVHLLEAVRQVGGVRAVVNVTTDKCYENRDWVWGYREDDALGGSDPYSSSKSCSELVTAAFRKSFAHAECARLATARAGNVIGGGDWAQDRLVPDVLRALQAGQTIQLRNPQSVRPWQHVLEPLSGYLVLAQGLFDEGSTLAAAWNFGPRDEDARTVQWVVERINGLWGSAGSWAPQPGLHPPEARHLKLDTSKARERLSWAPRWSLEIALQYTVEWHRAWLAGKDMRAICLDQLSRYQADA